MPEARQGWDCSHPGRPSLPTPSILSLGSDLNYPGKPSLPIPAILSLDWDSTTLGRPALPSQAILESGLGLNHPGKPSLAILAILSLGCLRVFDLPSLGKGEGGRAPFYLQGPEPPACLLLRAPGGRCWVQTSILPTLTNGCIDAGGGV